MSKRSDVETVETVEGADATRIAIWKGEVELWINTSALESGAANIPLICFVTSPDVRERAWRRTSACVSTERQKLARSRRESALSDP